MKKTESYLSGLYETAVELSEMGNYSVSKRVCFKILKDIKVAKGNNLKTCVYQTLASNYYHTKEHDQSMLYYFKALLACKDVILEGVILMHMTALIKENMKYSNDRNTSVILDENGNVASTTFSRKT